VLVNNAGYGVFGAVEELSLDEIGQQFDTNVVGLIAVTQAVLPHLRRQRSGHTIAIWSVFKCQRLNASATFDNVANV
jgi:hypothetical protein